MEARVTALKTEFRSMRVLLERMDERMSHLATSAEVAEPRGRIVSMPTTQAMVTAIVGGQIAFAGVILALLTLFRPH